MSLTYKTQVRIILLSMLFYLSYALISTACQFGFVDLDNETIFTLLPKSEAEYRLVLDQDPDYARYYLNKSFELTALAMFLYLLHFLLIHGHLFKEAVKTGFVAFLITKVRNSTDAVKLALVFFCFCVACALFLSTDIYSHGTRSLIIPNRSAHGGLTRVALTNAITMLIILLPEHSRRYREALKKAEHPDKRL